MLTRLTESSKGIKETRSKYAIEEKKAATPVNSNSKGFPIVGMNMTNSNFHEIADQSNKLNTLATNLPESTNKEKIMDRLLKSVNMVKEVLQSNLKLREQVQELGQRLELQSAELFYLQSENEEQKEKLQLITNLQESPTKQRLDAVERIIQLEKEKARLAKRVHDLEVQNTHIHTTAMPGTDDFEPVRSVINGTEVYNLTPIKEITGVKSAHYSTKYVHNRARNKKSSNFKLD